LALTTGQLARAAGEVLLAEADEPQQLGNTGADRA